MFDKSELKETININRELDTDRWHAVIKLGDRTITALSLNSQWSKAKCYRYMRKFLLYPKHKDL